MNTSIVNNSLLLESVVEFTHFLANSAPSVLSLDLSPSLWFLLLYIGVLGFDFKAQYTCILR